MTLKRCKHIIHAGIGKVAAALLSLSVLAGCADNPGAAPDEPELPVVEAEEQYVNLDLRISVNDGLAPGSRAFNPDDDGTFEPTANDYEKVHTLRVVIVREASGIIEHNRMVTVRDNHDYIIQSGDIINDNLRFKVVADEYKNIYLFANESAVNWNKEKDKFDFASQLKVGTKFPTEAVSKILIERIPGEAFINNDGEGPKTYIPMSEWFEDIEVPAASGNVVEEDFSITKDLFITRSLIKFSFSIALANTSDVQKIENCNLKGVKISNLADYGYYLPKNTTYKPDKDDDFDNYERRTIENFEVPGQNNNDFKGVSDCTFMFIDPLQISKEGDETGPLIYLPESKILSENTNYMLTLLFTDDTQDGHFESKPLEIRDIPRNTHVKINITLKKFNLDATVTVLPYTGVWLNPTFGIDRE